MKILKILPLVLSLFAAPLAHGHSDEYLDSQPTPHGGQMRMAGAYHFELVAKANELTVYLTDHASTDVPSQGASGTATVLAGKKKATVKLLPAGGNTLKGAGQFELAPDMKVVVSIALPGKASEQARFTPRQKSAAEHQH